MKRRSGMTLVELQTASVLMGIILVAIGVVLVTALNAVRVLNDAHTVYWNALAAMKSLQIEIMRSNRYGWHRGIDYTVPAESVYGVAGPDGAGVTDVPSLWGVNDGIELWLRADGQPELGGEPPATPQTYVDDVRMHFYLNGNDLMEDAAADNGFSSTRTIASHVSELKFSKLTYNAVAVTVIVQGELEDPLQAGNPKHEALVSTIVNLRCAAGQSCEGPHPEQPDPDMYADEGFW